jgi:hypothetical protein
MNKTREEVYSALFTLLASSSSFVTKSRKFKTYDQVLDADRPAIFMVEGVEEYSGGDRNLPPKTLLRVDVYIYVWTKDEDIPSAVLNPYLDAIDKVLLPNPVTGAQTLFGQAWHAWIDGAVLKDPGDFDGDAIAKIPISILVP